MRFGLVFVVLCCALLVSSASAAPAKVEIPFGGSLTVGTKGSCSGSLSLELRRGTKRLDRRSAKLSKTCQFKVSFRVTQKSLGKAKKLKVIVHFKGNKTYGPTKQTFIVDVPKTQAEKKQSPPPSSSPTPAPVATPQVLGAPEPTPSATATPEPTVQAPLPGANPRGAIISARRKSPSQAVLTGWASDADDESAHLDVTALVDGNLAGTTKANTPSTVYGPHLFTLSAAVDEAARTACVRATNIRGGSDATIACAPIHAFADLDGNGAVNCADLAIVQKYYGQQVAYEQGDLDGSGTVNIFDMSVMLSRLSGQTCS